MRQKTKHIIYILSTMLLMLTTACENEVLSSGNPDDSNTSDNKVRIEIFARANAYPIPVTKGVDDENKVGMTPWVLVFKGEGASATFIEAVQAYEVVGKRYVVLTKQPAGSKYQLLILANPQSHFYYGDNTTMHGFEESTLSAVAASATLSDVCRNLRTEPLAVAPLMGIPYGGAGDLLPMSYLLEVNQIDEGTKIENSDGNPLQLIRAVAKLSVANNAANFTLKEITAVVNVPRQGLLHNLDGSIPDNTANLTDYQADAGYTLPLAAAENVSGGQSTEKNPVYLYEFDQRGKPYIIIRGTYGGTDYYYKMALVDDALQPLNILRNRAYTFTIKTVKGPGYDTVEDAKVSKASNTDLNFEVLVDDTDSYEIMANNDYFLAVSNSVFIAYASDSTTLEAFKIATDCQVNFPNSNTITNNRSLVEYSFDLAPGNSTIPIKENNSSSPRITPVDVLVRNWLQWNEDNQSLEGVKKHNAYVTLKLGNLEKQIHIRQRDMISAAGDMLQYIPEESANAKVQIMNYYCLSGDVEDGVDWIKLRPAIDSDDRNDTEHIVVDNGKIYIEIQPNYDGMRSGIVYLTTVHDPKTPASGSTVKRIKIYISQAGRAVN
ncbi:FimB/Mfa2 family fimbrial subunit [uncultured Parabacteroides sp.]|uniref:FimB/Mfa2 family fimbrial subunit n=1 Tax=uncultured Parabacteroides sp. TaxID=512312 RepID=UPI0025EEF5D4|nr:FimB/Mfa2 family fimbrial subunit [uncultured Parabacteroides sp.]